MKEQGFIKLSRKFFKNPLWKEPRQYSRSEAWLDLIFMARFEDSQQILRNRVIEVRKGEIIASRRFLEERWSWGSTKVTNFLNYLQSNGMINQRQTAGQTILKLCNYDIYNHSQTNDCDGNEPLTNQWQTTHKPQTNQNKEYKESRKKEKNSPYSPPRNTGEIFSEYKSDLLSDDFWIESETMSSQIGIKFKENISELIDKFFGWIVSTGEENSIQSLKDAKRRFHYWWANTGRKEYFQNNVKDIPKGFNVWIENGKKYYGSGIEIPLYAPTRPSQDAKWDKINNKWTVSGG